MKRRILLMPSPTDSGSIGSVTKCIGLAKKIRNRGGEAAFAMGGRLKEMIIEQGFAVYETPAPVISNKIIPIRSTPDFMMWTGMTEPQYLSDSAEAEIKAIYEFQPDIVFAEARPSAAISTRAAKVPSAMIASWPMHPDFPANRPSGEMNIEPVNRLLKKYQQPAVRNITELMYMAADLKIVPTIPDLEPMMEEIPGLMHCGYILDTVSAGMDQKMKQFMAVDKPMIFIYLSVSALNPSVYREIILKSFEKSDKKILCACGYHYAQADLYSPLEHICFTKYVPANAVMEQAELVIFHGGQDTMLTALLYALPSITITGEHYEREYNALQLSRLGASIPLPVHAFRPGRLNQAVQEVLSGNYKENSIKLQKRLKQYGGADQCIDFLFSFQHP